MSLTFPYTSFTTPTPIIGLGGRRSRPKPIVSVGVTGPTSYRAVEALLDTGADDTVFNEAVALDIGVDLSTAPLGTGAGVGGSVLTVRYAEVVLRLIAGTERCEWRAWVEFTSVRLRRGLLGFAGCLQFFTATFHGDREMVELTANALLPPP